MRRLSILTIAGTDTGVGKTWIGCALARALRRANSRVVEVLGVVLAAPEQPDASTSSNAAAISRISGCSRILCTPRARDLETLSEHIQEVIQWLELA